ncbi:unnamed protein product [Brassica oleracea var. botrytis]|uniref:Uncharacterized protein n=4 Tax=Brassica TaxID=3705 RepID=A0ABQ8AFT8_BRANA|nr:hypothetical protein HID58_053848 [Brassica napus]VDC93700.1 unnamed protein product [Brassica oleracea]
MEVQAETQPGSSIKYSSSESSSYVHPTSLILHRQMGYTISKGIDLASAKRLLLVSNFYNANIAFVLARLQSNNSGAGCVTAAFEDFSFDLFGYSFGFNICPFPDYGTHAGIELCVCRDSCNSSRSRCNGCNKTREGAILAFIMIDRSSFFFCYLGHENLVRAAVETIG